MEFADHPHADELVQGVLVYGDRLRTGSRREVQAERLQSALQRLGPEFEPPPERLMQLWVELARELQRFPRHLSQHVGGFVLTQGLLTRLVPVENAAMDERTVIQWDKDDLDALDRDALKALLAEAESLGLAKRFAKQVKAALKANKAKLAALKERSATEYALFRKTFAHVIVGLGGESDEDTADRIAAYEASHGALTDAHLIGGLVAVLLQDAFNHKELQAVDGRRANGMSVMMMGASTGCNTVYGSTPPGNPHPYPWMNSLFQDGATISWLMAESVIVTHARSSCSSENCTLCCSGQW